MKNGDARRAMTRVLVFAATLGPWPPSRRHSPQTSSAAIPLADAQRMIATTVQKAPSVRSALASRWSTAVEISSPDGTHAGREIREVLLAGAVLHRPRPRAWNRDGLGRLRCAELRDDAGGRDVHRHLAARSRARGYGRWAILFRAGWPADHSRWRRDPGPLGLEGWRPEQRGIVRAALSGATPPCPDMPKDASAKSRSRRRASSGSGRADGRHAGQRAWTDPPGGAEHDCRCSCVSNRDGRAHGLRRDPRHARRRRRDCPNGSGALLYARRSARGKAASASIMKRSGAQSSATCPKPSGGVPRRGHAALPAQGECR